MMFKKLLAALLVIFFGLSLVHYFILAQTRQNFPEENLSEQGKLELIYFWRDGCPHCAKEEIFLDKLEKKYPGLEIKRYEVWYNQENQKIFQEYAKKFNIRQLGVPLTIIRDRYLVGYRDDETSGREIENYIKELLGQKQKAETNEKIRLPIFGEINLSKLSLPTLTITMGAIDGFNPCAMWVLLFLLSLLINTRSRKRMFLVGGTFIFTSGIVYFLILTGWLKLFLAVSYVNLTRILIGVFALGLGIWQIRNFVKYKGVCPIAEGDEIKGKIRDGLIRQAQKLVFSPLTPAILLGTILLALGINLIEFFCSAGLPAIYTRVLAINSLSPLSYYLYLLLYTFVFMLDDLIVFSLAIITLSKIGYTEKYNYWATLIGGLLILTLGILLIFKPEFLMFG